MSSPELPRCALVTGAARRLGREIALGLARAGWDVCVHYGRSRDAAEDTVAAIRAAGRRAVAVAADLDDEASTLSLFDQAQAALGPLSCLVNNASRFELDRPESVSGESLLRHLQPNLAAPLLLARRLYESLDERSADEPVAHGVVVNLLDQKLDNLNPDFFSYTLSKAALLAATKTMAMAFASRLRVNGVSPGATLQSWEQSPEGFVEANHIALLGRSSRPADIVQAVLYLVDAPAVTGVNLIVDGGQHLMPLDRDVMFLTSKF
jgi:NAD(P)-dependent dehydrogenase (short-subunit alcohol dehydrogenase family)